MTNIILNPTSDQHLKLRRLELGRTAMCQAFGIVDDESADLPADVVRMIGQEVGP